MNEFKIKDVVILNSGGPDMTIVEISRDDDDYVFCEWFNTNNEKQRSMFHYLTITLKTSNHGFNIRTI
jgi:uncharacterized protein YodC (DUF2158 family)